MIRTTAVPRPVRIGTALLGVAGIVTLAGCAGGTTSDAAAPAPVETTAAPAATSAPSESAATGSAATSGTYADGTYEATGQYATPESVETVDVTLTLAGDTITDVTVTGDPQAAESRRYQSEFIGGIAGEVVGKKLDEISVSKVAGSSLTSGGFNNAVETIKTEAKA
ncbi:FMN-binding protein [Microbacterium sp. lyk4-40-TSB-66]|uniref:FMN-binding protein n=1 Tax=Microbacterium sp. lyk4-40-TSB-66 TaxID=3040294 RepID=UPI00254FD5FF|nr:FMN-binding protein [Microbacterium sp. lyk4-40-TSB-66]